MPHPFQPGSGPLPDSDPERCDECGEQEDHRNHYTDDPSLAPSFGRSRHLYDVTLSVAISVEIPEGIDPESDEALDLAAAAADAADLPGERDGDPGYLEPDDDR